MQKQENFEDLLKEYELEEINTDTVYRGVVSEMDRKYVYVDSNMKSNIMIPLEDFSIFDEKVEVGSEIDYQIKELDDGYGQIIGSRKEIVEGKRWGFFEDHKKENKTIKGMALKANGNGLVVRIKDVNCYIPKSLIDTDYKVKASSLVGQEIEAKVVKINKATSSVVLSRKDKIKEDKQLNSENVVYNVGDKVKGVIKNIADFGAFVDLGAKDALLHISEMSWKKVRSISEILKEGEEITCEIVNIGKDGRISLSIKSMIENPWEKYNVGDKRTAIVMKNDKIGVICSIEDGVEGILINENIDKEALEIGQEIDVVIERVESNKMALSWVSE